MSGGGRKLLLADADSRATASSNARTASMLSAVTKILRIRIRWHVLTASAAKHCTRSGECRDGSSHPDTGLLFLPPSRILGRIHTTHLYSHACNSENNTNIYSVLSLSRSGPSSLTLTLTLTLENFARFAVLATAKLQRETATAQTTRKTTNFKRYTFEDFVFRDAQGAQDAGDVLQPITPALQVDDENGIYVIKSVPVPSVSARMRVSLNEVCLCSREKK